MKITFVRHAQTEENATNIVMGQGIGGTLSKEGISQAKKIAKRLESKTFRYIFTSDLQRSLDTVYEISAYQPQANVVKASALRERNLGVYEGQPRELLTHDMQNAPASFSSFKPENGESYEELQKRMILFLQALTTKCKGEHVLIVSHAGALAVLYLHLRNLPMTREQYDMHKPLNTAFTRGIFNENQKFEIEVLNSMDHLEA